MNRGNACAYNNNFNNQSSAKIEMTKGRDNSSLVGNLYDSCEVTRRMPPHEGYNVRTQYCNRATRLGGLESSGGCGPIVGYRRASLTWRFEIRDFSFVEGELYTIRSLDTNFRIAAEVMRRLCTLRK